MGTKIWEIGDLVEFKHWAMGVRYYGIITSFGKWKYMQEVNVRVNDAKKMNVRVKDKLVGHYACIKKGKILRAWRRGKLIYDRYNTW